MSSFRELEPSVVPAHEFTRWRRYGHDRLYVSVVEGSTSRQIGYRDLATGVDHPVDPSETARLASAADAWGTPQPAAPQAVAPSPTVAKVVETAFQPVAQNDPPPAPTPLPWQDLSLNRAGEAVDLEAQAARAAAPVRSTLARVLRVHTDERAWRIGAKGERLVGAQLDKLAQQDRRWTAIHSIRVGAQGADIDHLVMGPGGVFSLNTKHHPDADVWVGGDTFLVNGTRVPYVRNSRHEAARASRLLTTAVGRPVPVVGIVVLVGSNRPTVKTVPRDVHVVARRDLVRWMSSLGPVWTEADLAAIWEAARRSTTWT